MNAIAAVKALLRGKEDTARQLLVRGFERAGLPVPQGEAQELIPVLAEEIAAMHPLAAPLAGRIVELHRQVFGPAGT